MAYEFRRPLFLWVTFYPVRNNPLRQRLRGEWTARREPLGRTTEFLTGFTASVRIPVID